jgi:hypothetical protein
MAGQWRILVLGLAIAASGCVPIPYKPSASVTHVPVTAEEASVITVSASAHRGMLEPLAKSIHRGEPRIVVVDGAAYLASLMGSGTLADVVGGDEGSGAALADYLLCVGAPVQRQLHDTGLAAPFPYFPLIWVGYEKIQSRASLTASLVDLHVPHSAESLEVSSTYSEFIAAAVYGVATIARPQAALRDALAADVAHRLAIEHPTGTIRLIVLAQDGGDAEPDPNHGEDPPAQAVADAQGATR